jgi:hypothetical protein
VAKEDRGRQVAFLSVRTHIDIALLCQIREGYRRLVDRNNARTSVHLFVTSIDQNHIPGFKPNLIEVKIR